MRITIKQLENRINTINSILKTNIRLYKTIGCGVQLVINNEFVGDNLISNKEAMEYLDKTYNKQIREWLINGDSNE